MHSEIEGIIIYYYSHRQAIHDTGSHALGGEGSALKCIVPYDAILLFLNIKNLTTGALFLPRKLRWNNTVISILQYIHMHVHTCTNIALDSAAHVNHSKLYWCKGGARGWLIMVDVSYILLHPIHPPSPGSAPGMLWAVQLMIINNH
jgi:hypothetical protein